MYKPTLVILFLTIIIAAFYAIKLSNIPEPKKETEYKSGLTKSVNMYPFDFDQTNFSGFNVEIPYSYFVTSDEMLVDYDSQGGSAPPRLILMKGYQLLGERDYYDHIYKNPSSSCIALWSTKGFTKIDDWNQNVVNFKGPLLEQEDIPVGTRSAQIFKTKGELDDMYVGFLPINDSDNTSYFFNTCNTKNKSDLINTIKSLKFRGDAFSN